MVNTDRCYVICHMMSTIESKIDSGIKGKDILGDYYNQYSELEHQLKPQAWMCGRVTSEMFAEAVDTKGLLRWKNNTLTFEDKTVHQLIIIVTQATPKKYLSYLQDKDISYLMAGKAEVDFGYLFQKLKKEYQIDTLALEGGGSLNGSVMAADLIDEISLLITPLVLNRSNSPSVFERKVEEELSIKKYRLHEVNKVQNDAVWIRYRKYL